jgi:hypothetical protein
MTPREEAEIRMRETIARQLEDNRKERRQVERELALVVLLAVLMAALMVIAVCFQIGEVIQRAQ